MRLDKGQIEVVDDRVAEILRTKSGPERLTMVWADWSFFQTRIMAHLKNEHEHPEWTEEQIRKEILRRVTYGTR